MANKAGKSKKMGRDKVWCAAYRASGKSEIAKARRLLRHLAFNCTGKVDKSAVTAYKAMDQAIVKRAKRQLTSGAALYTLPSE